MPWSVVGSFNSATGNATSRSATIPSGTQAGDFIYVCLYRDESSDHATEASPNVTPHTGYTQGPFAENLMTGASLDFIHSSFWKIAESGDASASHTFTGNPSSSLWMELVCVVFRHSGGAVPSSGTIEDSDITNSDTTSTAWTAPASTSLTSGALHIISGSSWSGGAGSPPSTFDEAADNASEVQVGWKELGAAGTSTPGLYNAADDVWAAVGLIVAAPASQDTPELRGRPFGLRGAGQMRQLLAQ